MISQAVENSVSNKAHEEVSQAPESDSIVQIQLQPHQNPHIQS